MKNFTCPKCGGHHVEIVEVEKDSILHSVAWYVFIGWIYIIYVVIKYMILWCIGLVLFFYYDWWMAIVQKIRGKQHTWLCKPFFTSKKYRCYCHDCGCNFEK